MPACEYLALLKESVDSYNFFLLQLQQLSVMTRIRIYAVIGVTIISLALLNVKYLIGFIVNPEYPTPRSRMEDGSYDVPGGHKEGLEDRYAFLYGAEFENALDRAASRPKKV